MELLSFQSDISSDDIHACSDPDLLSCQIVLVNFDAFKEDEISLPGDWVLAKHDEDDTDGDFASVTFTDEEGSEATFTFKDGRAFGNVAFINGSDFVLEDCNNFPGCHIWKEEDVQVFENISGDDVVEAPQNRQSLNAQETKLVEKGKADKTTIVTYSVKFYYTRQFAKVTDDIPLFISQIVAETNQGYKNSKVPLRMVAHCIEAAKLDDIKGGSKMLQTFRDSKGTIDKLRASADAAVLLVKSFDVCGIGYLRGWEGPKWAVSVTQKGCSLGYYTMGHELGHNLGNMHDKVQGPNKYFKYGLGKHVGPDKLDGKGYMTIMAYQTATHRREINYYSNPDIKFRGKYVTGSADENNARVLTETRFAMASVGDESEKCALSMVTPTTTSTTTTTTPATTTTATTANTKCKDKECSCSSWPSSGFCTKVIFYIPDFTF